MLPTKNDYIALPPADQIKSSLALVKFAVNYSLPAFGDWALNNLVYKAAGLDQKDFSNVKLNALVKHPSYKRVTKAIGRLRNAFYEVTTAWESKDSAGKRKGHRLITKNQVKLFSDNLLPTGTVEIQIAIDSFVAEFPSITKELKAMHSKDLAKLDPQLELSFTSYLDDCESYTQDFSGAGPAKPVTTAIRPPFDITFAPVPKPEDLGIDMPGLRSAQTRTQKKLTKNFTLARIALHEKLQKFMVHFADSTAAPDKTFRDSLTANLSRIATIVQAADPLLDPNLTRFAQEAQALAAESLEDIRKDPEKRKKASKKAKSIAKDIQDRSDFLADALQTSDEELE